MGIPSFSEQLSRSVFISYRREVGGLLATALFQHLRNKGFDAFFDIESLRAGRFVESIEQQIRQRPYLVLVLTPGTLDRCRETDDLLRREIEHAVRLRRVIVPVFTPNFDFRDFDRFLPRDLASTLKAYNGLEMPHRWFKYAVAELCDEFLTPLPFAPAAVTAADQAFATQIIHTASALPPISQEQLTAQEVVRKGQRSLSL